MKVVYIRYLPLTREIEQKFYFEALLQAGFEVEYWDISKLYSFVPRDTECYQSQLNIRQYSFHSYKELACQLKANKKALFWSIMTLEYRLWRLWWLFNKYQCKKIVLAHLPIAFGSLMTRPSLFKKNIVIPRCMNLLMKICIQARILRGYEYVFMGGAEGWRSIGLMGRNMLKSSKIFPIHSMDYDNFVQLSQKNLYHSSNKYIIFLDQYLPFHPDNMICGLVPPDPDEYYKVMNHVFDVIEEKYKLPVVIAAHPKALKYHHFNYYGGRDVIFGKTMDLILSSELVVLHNSTSVATAIMAQKPLLFIDAECIEKANVCFNNDILSLSKLFSSPCLRAETLTSGLLPDLCNMHNTFDLTAYKMKYLSCLPDDSMRNKDAVVKAINEIFAK